MTNRVFSQTFGVVGAILVKDGKVLLVKEGSHNKGVDEGKWNQPAGWIEVGENPIQAAKREAEEESGYKFKPTHLLGIYSLVRKDVSDKLGGTPHAIKLIFKGDLLSDVQNKLEEDVTETKWFSPEEIYAMDETTLRDIDIKQEVKDYFRGREISLNTIVHTMWSLDKAPRL